MRSQQHPIGTPFGPASTADDVLAGLDLTGRGVVVTGGHAGIGLEVTRALARAGASVTVAARDTGRALAAIGEEPRVEVEQLDLVDPASIDAFVGRWLASRRPLHALVDSAGVPAPHEWTLDGHGNELQFATSHLGHFRLTLGLRPALAAAGAARVVVVTSGAQRFGAIRWDDLAFAADYVPEAAYAQAKRANVLFAVELDRRWAAEGIRGYAVHPGIVAGTALNGWAGEEPLRAMGLIDESGAPIIDPQGGKKTPQQGASTVVLAAASPLLDGVGGVYLLDNDVSAVDDEDRPMSSPRVPADVVSASIDPQDAERLWAVSEALLAPA